VGRLPTDTGTRVVVVDPAQPKKLYAGAEVGVYRSDDAGETWSPASRGLPDGVVEALAMDPWEHQRLYAGTLAGPLYLSEDGADAWRPLAGTGRGAAR